MEKEKVTDRRKSTKKSYKKFEKDLDEVKSIVKKSSKKTEKTVPCQRCKAKALLVKTNGCHEVYKCTKCKRTTERWI